MGKKIKTYRDLNIWKMGIELVKDIYKDEIRRTKLRKARSTKFETRNNIK